MQRFADRIEAGLCLARLVRPMLPIGADALVLALPRGGLPVAEQIAKALHAPLDIFLVRKLGYPGHEEFAMGAIASGGIQIVNEAVFGSGRATREQLEIVAAREKEELDRREQLFRGDHAFPKLLGKIIILVDDGLATGSTMRAAVAAVKQQHPGRLIVAVPVGSTEACAMIAAEVDDLICPLQPEPFFAVGRWYEDFTQTTDEEVQTILKEARTREEELNHA